MKEAIEKQDFLLETDNNENFGDFICISSKVSNGREKKKIMFHTNYEICFIFFLRKKTLFDFKGDMISYWCK